MAEPNFSRIGKYEIQAELGRGGFGRVYKAFDPTVGRPVAVKVLTAEGGKDLLTRFKNEAAAAGNLHHENIVTIYEFGEYEGISFIAMEFLEGEDLHQALASGKPLTILEKANIMMQVADGLDCAHRNGIVHRDVKPGNIRLLPDGNVKIMDFGIARLLGDAASTRLTRQGHVIGTLLYMAPEQVMGSDTDALCDIFAYGVTCYELLAGTHPFRAPDPRAVFYKITSEDPVPLRSLVPQCPEPLEQVVRRALQKERELRYQTLRDVVYDLEPVLTELRQQRAAELLVRARELTDSDDIEHSQEVLTQVLDLDPGNRAARQLRETVQQALQRRALQPRIDSLVRTGDAALEEGRYPEALESYEAALRFDRADAVLQAKLTHARTAADRARQAAALVAEARTALAQNDPSAALERVSRASELDPKNFEAKQLLENVCGEIDRLEARRRLEERLHAVRERLARNSPDDALALLAGIDPSQKAAEVNELRERAEGLKIELRRRECLRAEASRAQTLIENGRLAEAIEILQAVRPELPDDDDVAGLLDRTQAALREQERVRAMEQEIGRALSDSNALLSRGDLARAIERLEAELARFQDESRLSAMLARAKTVNQASAEAKRFIGAREYSGAFRVIDRALAAYPSEPSLLRLREQAQHDQEIAGIVAGCEALQARNRCDEALQEAQGALNNYPEEAALQELHQRLEASRRAQQELARQRAQAERERAVSAIVAQCEALGAKNRFDEALQQAERALGKYPEETALQELRQRLESERRTQQELARQRAQAERERAVAAAVAQCEALGAQSRLDEALQQVERAQSKYPEETALQELRQRLETERRAQQELARQRAQAERERAVAATVSQCGTLRSQSRFDEALRQTERALRKYPEEAVLLELRTRLGREREAWESASRALEHARGLLKRGQPGKAVEALRSARVQYPNEPSVQALWTEAQNAVRAEQKSQAVAETAAEATRMLERGRPAAAVASLEQTLARLGSEPALESLLSRAQEALRAEQRNQAIDQVCREARTYLDANDFDQALLTLDRNLERYGGDQRLIHLRDAAVSTRARWERERATPRPEMILAGAAITEETPLPPGAEEAPPSRRPEPPSGPSRSTARRPNLPLWGLVAAAGVGVLVWEFAPARGGAVASLEVVTHPTGAEVRVGDHACRTPGCRLELPSGNYDIQARLSGYTPKSTKAALKTGTPARIEIALEPLSPSLLLSTNFTQGSVSLNGRPAGKLQGGQFRIEPVPPGRSEVNVSGPDGEAAFSFEVAPSRLPSLGPLRTQGTSALVFTGFGGGGVVTCSSCGGPVLLDGRPAGEIRDGKLELTGLSAGRHEIRLSGEGQPNLVFEGSGAPALSVAVVTTRNIGTLIVDAGEDGAGVFIDGKRQANVTRRGELRIPVEAAEHVVRVEKRGFRSEPAQARVQVGRGEQVSAAFKLQAQGTTLAITGALPGSRVLVDGRPAGVIPANGRLSLEVAAGDRELAFVKDGYNGATLRRTLAPGRTVALDGSALDMKPLSPPAEQRAEARQAPVPPAPPRPDPAVLEARDWDTAKGSRSVAVLQDFLRKYPGGPHAADATRQIEQIDWDNTDKRNASSLGAFLARHPSGDFAGQARNELDRMEREAARAAQARQATERMNADREALIRVLSAYSAAYERKDAGQVAALWPSLSQKQRRELEQAFRTFRSVRMELAPVGPAEISGDTARVRCDRSADAVDREGSHPQKDQVTVTFRRVGGRWLIDGIGKAGL